MREKGSTDDGVEWEASLGVVVGSGPEFLVADVAGDVAGKPFPVGIARQPPQRPLVLKVLRHYAPARISALTALVTLSCSCTRTTPRVRLRVLKPLKVKTRV